MKRYRFNANIVLVSEPPCMVLIRLASPPMEFLEKHQISAQFIKDEDPIVATATVATIWAAFTLFHVWCYYTVATVRGITGVVLKKRLINPWGQNNVIEYLSTQHKILLEKEERDV